MTDVAVDPVAPFAGPDEQLAGELAWLELQLRRRVLEAQASRASDERFDEFAGLFVPEGEIRRYASEGAPEGGGGADAAGLSERIAMERASLDARLEATLRAGLEPRLHRLARRFRLSVTEVRLLVCCAAADWAMRFQRYFAYLQNDVQRRRPTVQLLGEVCCGPDPALGARLQLGAGSPLVREGLLTITAAELPFPARQPVVAESVLEFLAGVARPDPRLAGIATVRAARPVWPVGRWYDRHREIVASLRRTLERDGGLPPVYLGGPDGAAMPLVVEAVAASAGAPVLRVDCRAWLGAGGWTRETLVALRRDAILHGAVVELANMDALADAAGGEPRAAAWCALLRTALDESALPVVIMTGTTAVDTLMDLLAVPLRGFEIPRPALGEREELWERELVSRAISVGPGVVGSLASAFRFTPGEMRQALDASGVGAVPGAAPAATRAIGDDVLVRACRETSRRSLQRLARRIEPRRTWDDLVLPEDSRQQLEEICAGARGRRRVHDEWGFERALGPAAGTNVLFAGPSGVGKSMSAEIVAGALGLDLYAVDLSRVVSKYIGETEKNLGAVFDQAESTSCVLFFDECDAIFGKRTEIRDAHDRWANLEVNFLLQRVERYDGIVILATNLRSNLDAALTRRIRYAVEFPFPEAPQREQIWRKVFPREAPVSPDVDLEFMARQFKLAGGSIRNIAVNAAFLAASNGGQVTMKHVIHATRRELQKMGRSCTRTEFGRYFPWVRDAATGAEGVSLGASA